MSFQLGKVIVGKAEKYNGLLGPVYLCRLLKSTKIADGKSSYMIIVFMKTLAFGEGSMKSSTIGTNFALEARPYGACSSHPLFGWLLTSVKPILKNARNQ